MSRPNSLGDFDVVTGPPAPIRRIVPAMPASAPDGRQPARALNEPGAPPADKAEAPAR